MALDLVHSVDLSGGWHCRCWSPLRSRGRRLGGRGASLLGSPASSPIWLATPPPRRSRSGPFGYQIWLQRVRWRKLGTGEFLGRLHIDLDDDYGTPAPFSPHEGVLSFLFLPLLPPISPWVKTSDFRWPAAAHRHHGPPWRRRVGVVLGLVCCRL